MDWIIEARRNTMTDEWHEVVRTNDPDEGRADARQVAMDNIRLGWRKYRVRQVAPVDSLVSRGA